MMSDRKSHQSRRTFLQNVADRLPLFLAAMLASSRKGLPRQDKQNPVLATVKIADNPALDKLGGFVLVKNTPVGDVLIVRTGDDQYTAMSDICPHKQCRVEVKSETLIKCPCHGSAYKIDGTYVSGPSHKSLQRFRISVADGVITVTES